MSEIKFFYLRDRAGKPYACIGARESRGDDDRIEFATSVCHKGDTFIKDRARKMVRARLERGKVGYTRCNECGVLDTDQVRSLVFLALENNTNDRLSKGVIEARKQEVARALELARR